ncbi:MAG TPA: 2-dehydropantoate 2-reductase, partial [Leptospiraceae bacterium]|nr:2-dehydropantoate 2-reductase [Leptospiraceae bacterium]
MKNILILGSGGIASLYGSMMQRHGFSVSLYARRNSEEIASGIQVDSVWGNYFFRPENVFTEIDFSKYRPDLIISSLKALPEIRLGTILKGLPEKIPVLLLQNGIGLEEEFAELFPKNPVFAGLAFVCSNRHSPVYVNHLDYGQITVSPYLRSDMSLAEKIYSVFKDSGVP